MDSHFSSIESVLLSMQRALLGAVTPHLRAVLVDIDTKKELLFFFFYYDCEVTDELFDLASGACAEASADFPDYFVEEEVITQLNDPQSIPKRGHYAYLKSNHG
jgi:hypothetical protein